MGTVYGPAAPLRNRRGLTPGGPPRGQTGNRKRFLSIYVNSAIMEEIVKG